MPSLLFLPFASNAEVGFWKNVSEKKLQSIKLSEDPLPLQGHYTTTASSSTLSIGSSEVITSTHTAVNTKTTQSLKDTGERNVNNPLKLTAQEEAVILPPRFTLGDRGLVSTQPTESADDAPPTPMRRIDGLPLDAVPVQGVLKLMNQLDHFQSVDKQQLLETEGYKVWRDIVSGRALEHPELLNRSLLLAYIDLKKFLYYFWFAFPALSLKYEMDRPGIPLSAHRSQTYVDHMLATHVRQGRPAFFCIVDTDGLDPDADGEVVELKAWEAAVDKPNRRLTVGFLDPSTHPQHPGWPLRNLLALVRFHTHARVDVIDVVCLRKNFRNGQASTERSIAFKRLRLPAMDGAGDIDRDITSTADSSNDKVGHQVAVQMAMPKIVGWERNVKGKLGPRVVNLGASMDPRTLAESAIDLNLSLMKWRILPGLDLDVIKDTKCLLLGAGTLGCNVARCLMGWGVRHITFVDNGYVSYSNPARQSLFSFKDCIGGGTEKAIAAAANLAEIFPGMVTEGHHMSIPMPGHSVAQSEEAEIRQTVDKLSDLIAAHDVVYLLMDTRESRWLPTLLCQSMNKLALNAALGFDQYMVMRHGTQKSQDDVRLGCYFCNDVVAPANSTKDRTLDQQCTVTRPGLSFMASALATELMVSVLQHPLKEQVPGDVIGPNTSIPEDSILGFIPHQTRGFLSHYNMVMPVGRAYDRCTGCSRKVVEMYKERGFQFLLDAFNSPTYLEDVTGLTEMKAQMEEVDFDMDLSSEDDSFSPASDSE